MTEEITSTEVREWRKANAWTLAELGAALGGLDTSQVSKMENGGRNISPAEQRLLRILMYRELPENFPTFAELGHGEILFTAPEWELIGNMARAVGRSPEAWIAERIREYLAYQQVRARQAVVPPSRGLYGTKDLPGVRLNEPEP
jgi:transcriptional regulator with XRE-family HTH domain